MLAVTALSVATAASSDELSQSGDFLDGVAALVDDGVGLKRFDGLVADAAVALCQQDMPDRRPQAGPRSRTEQDFGIELA